MTRQFETHGAPHVPAGPTVSGVMREVLWALVPGIAVNAWFFGPGVLLQIVFAVAFALLFEALMLKSRGRPLRPFLTDFSAVLTAVLFALCIPPLAPWWIAAIGMLFAIVVAKHLYGGLGDNLFNPAMVGYVVVLVSFPQILSAWPGASTGLDAALAAILAGQSPSPAGWDAVTGATVLDAVRNGTAAGAAIPEIRLQPGFGRIAGQAWEWVALAYAAGGAWLLARRIISWHVPAAMLGAVVLFGLTGWLVDPSHYPSPVFDLLAGGMILGAFFIATDPVSGCTSDRGRLVFGAGVGILTLVIRRWGGYPDGVAFAVLLMNLAAPLIDRFTRPRIFGHD